MTGCRYWIGSDATGRRCNADPVEHGLCGKHLEVERRRAEKTIEKDRAAAARREAAWRERNLHRLPAWRAQLERAEAEYARRAASPTGDRAAVGGNTHPSIVRAQARHLSDTNVSRVVELEGIITRLRRDIARAEGGAQ